MKRIAITVFAVVGLLLTLGMALAETSKLDPRTRATVTALRGGAAPASIRANRFSVSDNRELNVFITGSISKAELEAMGVRVRTALPGIYTAWLPVGSVDAVAGRADVTAIRGAQLCQTSNDVSMPAIGATQNRGAGPNFTGINGAGVLVGDVDTGIDTKHGDFKDAAGLSRILYLWDQNSVAGPNPAGYAYGREWFKADIDANLCTETDANGHGTHVMGTAAGDGSKSTTIPFQYAGAAPKADIAMVATTLFDSDIVDGVAYIFGKATSLGENSVVNLSLGGEFGPHDGSSAFEQSLDAMSGPGRVICVAAGNDAGSNIHGGMDVPAAGDSMKFTVTGGTTNGRAFEINGWYNAPDNMTVKLRTPGNLIITLPMGSLYGTQDPVTGFPTSVTGVNGKLYWENGVSTSSNGARLVYIIAQATGTGTGSITGTWTLYYTPVSMVGPTSRVDMWRDYVSTTSLACTFSLKNTNDHLVSEPANALRVVTVGAWQSRYDWLSCNGSTFHFNGTTLAGNGTIASFSGIGPTRDGRNKPDIVAPGSAIISAMSQDVATTCTGGNAPLYMPDGPAHMVNSGTSMATPHATGATALLMQKFGAWTPEQVKAYLFANAIIDANTGAPWNAVYGNGKLHLTDLVNPTVAVTSANGGETWYIGTGQSITWSASDNVGVTSVDLLLSRDGGATFPETIASGVANSGSFAWTVTGPSTGTAILKVVAHDAAANTAFDVSDANFAIQDAVTGTLLSTFVANAVDGGIQLRWQLGTTNFSSLGVDRATTSTGPWQTLSLTPTRDGEQYVALDANVTGGQTYFYRLTGVSGGVRSTLGQISGTAGQTIKEFALTRVSPNPTRSFTSIEFTVPRVAPVKITILDVAGREVAKLADGAHNAGRYQLVWSGEVSGHKASPGMYFVRMQAPGVRATSRISVTR